MSLSSVMPGTASTRARQWPALATSLRALGHPVTLVSIGLLLLNDHVLKALAPSPLTGKLSDLAGLFFFPFLLAALLSLPLDRLCVPPRRTAALAFGVTLAWFALIKTVPPANALMVDALSRLLCNPLKPADIPIEVTWQLEQPVQLPIIVCDPDNLRTCYRITGAEVVEGSSDGGQTWQVVWQVPPGRRKFMELAITRHVARCKQSLDIGPYDLVFHSRNGVTTLVVASGNEGIVVRTSDGTWQRYAVCFAYPTSYAIEDWRLGFSFLPLLLFYENSFSLGMAVLAWLALCILGWSIILSRMHVSLGRSLWWVLAPILLAVGLWVLSGLLVYVFDPSPENNKRVDVLVTLVLLIPALVPVGPALAWHRVASRSSRRWTARRAALVCFLAPAGIFPLAWLPFPLWALGIIPVYEMALALSVLVGIVVLACGGYAVRRLSRLAVTPIETTEVTT